jgi:hypothetical protein
VFFSSCSAFVCVSFQSPNVLSCSLTPVISPRSIHRNTGSFHSVYSITNNPGMWPKSRLAYCTIFVLHIATVWLIRDFASEHLKDFPFQWIHDHIFTCSSEQKYEPCFKNTVVGRLTFGYGLFHLVLALMFIVRFV